MKKWMMGMMAAACLFLVACGGSDKTKDVPTADLAAAVQEAYGENFAATAETPEEYLEELYGVKLDDLEEYTASMSMISVNPDQMLIVKAKEGKADAVEEALNQAKENLIANTFTYPMNQAKVNATTVVREGNYIALFMLGQADMESETDEEAKEFAEAQVQIAVDTFRKALTK